MPKFNEEKHAAFDVELGDLVEKYMDMSDVDALSLYEPLARRAEEVKFIGIDERRKFQEQNG